MIQPPVPPDQNQVRSDASRAEAESADPRSHRSVLFEMAQVSITTQHEGRGVCLESVDWRVERGHMWVIGGPPESGKSALLATAAGLLEPASGQILVKGEPLASLRENQRIAYRLGMVLVHEAGVRLLHNLTLAQNIALPLQYHQNLTASQVEPRLRALLDLAELTPWAHRLPEQVSRAVRQRTVLARALAVDPEVLLLDNPLEGLGPFQSRWWLDLLDRLRKGQNPLCARPMTLIVAADSYQPWLRFDAQFSLIKGRRCIFLGTREDLLSSEESLVRELLRDAAASESV